MVLTKALIRYGTINSIRYIADHGIVALYKKYDYKHQFRRCSEVDEQGKWDAKIFIEALKGVQELEKKKIPNKERMHLAIGVYCGMNNYLNDVKGEALDKLSNAARVIRRDSNPDEVKKALEDLKWFRNLAEERTQDDYETYGAIISGRPHVPSI